MKTLPFWLFILIAMCQLGPVRAQAPRPGVECGCDAIGPYQLPKIKAISWNALASKGGTYTAEPWPGRLGLVIRKNGEMVKNIGPFSDPIHWGFSPDEHRLVIHAGEPSDDLDAQPIQHWCFLHNLESPGDARWDSHGLVRSAASVFSPNGRYLLYAVLDGQSRSHLHLVDALQLDEVATPNFWAEPVAGEPRKKLGIAAWGFSSEPSDATFFYAFNDGGDINANLFSLTSARRVIANWMIDSPATWGFSPCGDLFAITTLPADGSANIWLMQTSNGTKRVSGANVGMPFGGIFSDAEEHYAVVGSSHVYLDTSNTADDPCGTASDEPPFWPEGAVAIVQFVDAASVRIAWGLADGNGSDLAGYEVRQTAPEERVLGYVPAGESRKYTARNLAPDTDYAFAVYAQNLAGLWTAESLTIDAHTAASDSIPEWPSGAELRALEIGETTVTLEWDEATDDEAVTHYQLWRDGEVVATIPGDQLTYVAEDLQTEVSYRFRVQAGDAEDQWSTDGPDLRVSTVDRSPPTWPVPSQVYARETSTTRIDVGWTEAIDNVGVVDYRLYLIHGRDQILFASLGTSTHFEFSCLRPGTTFHFKVEAGDDAGNWSTNGPSAVLRTLSGPLDCERTLEVISVSSREEIGAGVWYHDGRDWGRYNAAESRRPAVSADGRFVAFESSAVNLVPNDINSHYLKLYENGGGFETWATDIFVRDRLAGTTERVSVSSGGVAAPIRKSSRSPAISGDGRYVVFVSTAPNLVDNDDNGLSDIFLRDLRHGTTVRIPELGFGQEVNAVSKAPTISSNGLVIAFVSAADNLVANDGNNGDDIFVFDRSNNQLSRVSVSGDGTEANGRCWGPSLSATGRMVAFISDANNLVPDDTNGRSDVFVHDRETGETERVSVTGSGEQANDDSAKQRPDHPPDTKACISADGRFVAFDSYASNLVPDDTNSKRDIFVRDRQTGETHRVNLSSSGDEANWEDFSPTSWFGCSWEPSMSGDGRWIAFMSNAPNLVPDDGNSWTDIFLHDRDTGITERVNVCFCGEGGTETDEWSGDPVVSSDGQVIAFASHAYNLTPNLLDLNDSEDIFVYENAFSSPDQDGDGTADAQEHGPGGDNPDYDGNEDGIPDGEQDYVASLHSLVDPWYVTAVSAEGLRSIHADAIPNPGGTPPTGVNFPFGFFRLSAHDVVEPGGALRFIVFFPAGVPFNTYYKYGMTRDDPFPHWYEFNYDGRTGAEIHERFVVLHLVDGDRGDADLEANGSIIDPGGPAQVGTATAPRLEVSATALEFHGGTTAQRLELSNTGGRPMNWAVDPVELPAWLTVAPTQATLAPGEVVSVQITVDPGALVAGEFTHALEFRSGGGTQSVQVSFEVGLRIRAHAAWDGSCLVIEWSTEEGRTYRVQNRAQLTGSDWVNRSTTLTADGPVISWVDCLEVDAEPVFYRVVQESK